MRLGLGQQLLISARGGNPTQNQVQTRVLWADVPHGFESRVARCLQFARVGGPGRRLDAAIGSRQFDRLRERPQVQHVLFSAHYLLPKIETVSQRGQRSMQKAPMPRSVRSWSIRTRSEGVEDKY